MTSATRKERDTPHGDLRDPAAITGLWTGVTFVSAIIGAIVLAKSPLPRPGAPAGDVRRYYRESRPAARFSVAGQLVSIVLLARFTMSVVRLARRDTDDGSWLPRAALVTGAGAAALLTTSAATHAVLTVPAERDDAQLVRAARRVFIVGGPIHGVVYGLFVATATMAGRNTGVIGPATSATGLASSAAGIFSPAYFRWENAGWLIPIGRFGGYLVSAILGSRLARGSLVHEARQ
jgi:hypothetical protein